MNILRNVVIGWLITCAAASALSLYVNYKELASGSSGAYDNGRLGSDTLNPISLGHLGVTLTLMAVHFFHRKAEIHLHYFFGVIRQRVPRRLILAHGYG